MLLIESAPFTTGALLPRLPSPILSKYVVVVLSCMASTRFHGPTAPCVVRYKILADTLPLGEVGILVRDIAPDVVVPRDDVGDGVVSPYAVLYVT